MKLIEAMNAREKEFMSRFIDELDDAGYIDWDKSEDSICIADKVLGTFKRNYRGKIPNEFIDVVSRNMHPETWEELSKNVCDNSSGDDCWCFWPDSITKITIPEGVKHIPEMTFCGCHNLTSIVIPKSVTDVGRAAFVSSGLKTINIPITVLRMRPECFEECTQLESVIFAEDSMVNYIGWNMFKGCTALKSITLSKWTWHIGEDAFYGCTSLTSVHLPYKQGDIEEDAFAKCTSLTTLQLGGAWEVAKGSLRECPKLVMSANTETNARMLWDAGCRKVMLRGKPYQLTESLKISSSGEGTSKAEKITDFIEDLYDLRKSSIANDGEYGLGNLVFKEMRALGYLDNLRNLKNEIIDKNLSLESLCENFSVDNLSEQYLIEAGASSNKLTFENFVSKVFATKVIAKIYDADFNLKALPNYTWKNNTLIGALPPPALAVFGNTRGSNEVSDAKNTANISHHPTLLSRIKKYNLPYADKLANVKTEIDAHTHTRLHNLIRKLMKQGATANTVLFQRYPQNQRKYGGANSNSGNVLCNKINGIAGAGQKFLAAEYALYEKYFELYVEPSIKATNIIWADDSPIIKHCKLIEYFIRDIHNQWGENVYCPDARNAGEWINKLTIYVSEAFDDTFKITKVDAQQTGSSNWQHAISIDDSNGGIFALYLYGDSDWLCDPFTLAQYQTRPYTGQYPDNYLREAVTLGSPSKNNLQAFKQGMKTPGNIAFIVKSPLLNKIGVEQIYYNEASDAPDKPTGVVFKGQLYDIHGNVWPLAYYMLCNILSQIRFDITGDVMTEIHPLGNKQVLNSNITLLEGILINGWTSIIQPSFTVGEFDIYVIQTYNDLKGLSGSLSTVRADLDEKFNFPLFVMQRHGKPLANIDADSIISDELLGGLCTYYPAFYDAAPDKIFTTTAADIKGEK